MCPVIRHDFSCSTWPPDFLGHEVEVVLDEVIRAVVETLPAELEPLVIGVEHHGRHLGPHQRRRDIMCSVVADEALEGAILANVGLLQGADLPP